MGMRASIRLGGWLESGLFMVCFLIYLRQFTASGPDFEPALSNCTFIGPPGCHKAGVILHLLVVGVIGHNARFCAGTCLCRCGILSGMS